MSTVPFSRSRSFTFDKPLPNNPEAERTILAAILLDNSLLSEIRSSVQAQDFFHESNRAIYRHILQMADKKEFIDLLTLTDSLTQAQRANFAGGIPYLSSICDGAVRVANVMHYVKIVREKAVLREIIHKNYDIAARAMEGETKPERFRQEMEAAAHSIEVARRELRTVTSAELLLLDVEPLEYMLMPILPVKGIGMMYASRGAGKTYVAMEIAHSIAVGQEKCFVWDIPRARKVLYIDGEMDVQTLQERHREIAKGHGGLPAPDDKLEFITPDLQDNLVPRINTGEGRAAIEATLRAGMLLMLDNLSALAPSSTEEETGDWVDIQEWLLHLRRKGVTTLFMHHAGKSGTQRGSSVKEDLLNVVINLRRGGGYQTEDQLRVEVHLEKLRGKSAVGEWVQPFELSLTTDTDGAQWLHRPLKHIVERQAMEMFAAGMKPNDIAQDLRLSRFQVYRLQKKFQTGQTEQESE